MDTGASKTVISTKVFNRIETNRRPQLVKSACLRGAGGMPIKEKGMAEFTLRLGSLEIFREAVVADVEDEVLLGNDILGGSDKEAADILLSKGKVVLDSVEIPCFQIGRKGQTRKLVVAGDVKEPGLTESFVDVHVESQEDDGADTDARVDHVIQPNETFKERYPLVLASSLVSSSEAAACNVRILNPYASDVDITQDAEIGVAERIERLVSVRPTLDAEGKSARTESIHRTNVDQSEQNIESPTLDEATEYRYPNRSRVQAERSAKADTEPQRQASAGRLTKYRDTYWKDKRGRGLTDLTEQYDEPGYQPVDPTRQHALRRGYQSTDHIRKYGLMLGYQSNHMDISKRLANPLSGTATWCSSSERSPTGATVSWIDCSCERSCGLTDSCCYPEQAVLTYFDRRRQQCELSCTVTSSNRAMVTKKRFYMVTDGYGNDSSENCGTGNLTCGENEAASALGRLYPVSSKTTRLIYKNEQCARCHGVVKSDIIPWQAVMSCLLHNDRFDTLLQSLELGRVHDSCWLDFYYPGPQSEINVHQCYEHTTHNCLHYDGQSFNLPSYLNMTEDDVRRACLTGPQAQYRNYYNLFCFLCNGGVYTAEHQCVGESLDDRATSPGTFSTLIDAKFLENKAIAQLTDVKIKARNPVACKRRDGIQSDADDCRPVLCPSGKLRSGATCVNAAKTMFSRNVKVAIELDPRNYRNVSPLIDYLKSYLQEGTDWRTFIITKGLESWHLIGLCYLDDIKQEKKHGSIGFLWLRLTLKKGKSLSYANILAKVNKFMTRDWEFVTNRTSVPLEQSFSKFEYIGYNVLTNSFTPRYFDNRLPELTCTTFGLPSRNPSIQVTKTFFCEQVALNPEGYVLDKWSKILYVNETRRVLRPAEYSLVYDANGDPEPRLCLEDTDYVLVPQQHPASPSGVPAYNDWLILALFIVVELI